MPLPWQCSRPGWMELWATWAGGRCPCSCRGVGTRWALRSLPTQTILWFYDSMIFSPSGHFNLYVFSLSPCILNQVETHLFLSFTLWFLLENKQNSTTSVTTIYFLMYFLFKKKEKKWWGDWNHSRMMLTPVFASLCLMRNLHTYPCRPLFHPSVMLLIMLQWLLMRTQSQPQWPGFLSELPAPAFGCGFDMPATLWSPNWDRVG